MQNKEYNGWFNYETWCVNLWMDNEQGSQEYYRQAAFQCWEEAKAGEVFTREEAARYALADWLKAEFDDAMPDLGSTVWTDMLNASFSEVNWDDIAKAWMEGVDKSEPVEVEDD